MNPAPANLQSAVPPVKPFNSGSSTSFTTPSPNNTQSKQSEKTNEVVVAAKSLSTEPGKSGHKDKQAEENTPKTQQGVAPTQTNTDVAAVKPLNADKQERTDPTPTSQQSAIPQPVKPFNSGSSTSFTTPSPNNAQSKQSEKTNEVVVASKSLSTEPGKSGHKDKQAEANTPKTQLGMAPTQTNTDVAGVKPLNSDKQKKTDPTSTSQQSAIPPEAGTNLAAVKSPNPESRTSQPEPPADGPPALKTNDDTAEPTKEAAGVKVAMSVTPSSTPLESKSVVPTPIKTSSDEKLLTKIYRVGPNDVLDVQIDGTESPRSTLFTVTSAGFLEHPMLAEPLLIAGFTPDEISSRIETDLSKRAQLDNPKVVVGVRDYASHSILVSGLVKESGTKFLRREAIPLYVVVADAQPLPQAGRVAVVRNETNQIFDIDLTQAAEMNFMVRPGDVITLQPNVTQFFYISGEVKFPGEKTFRRGLTLTQAIITAGGSTRKTKVAQIARDDGLGFLVEIKVDLKEIQSGKTADPLVRPGDRITILR
jgi:protein involved in polysaccharide export with SLBB domain